MSWYICGTFSSSIDQSINQSEARAQSSSKKWAGDQIIGANILNIYFGQIFRVIFGQIIRANNLNIYICQIFEAKFIWLGETKTTWRFILVK